MKKTKFDKVIEKKVLSLLDIAAKKHGITNVRHATNKWANAQRDKARLAKQRVALERELVEVYKRLSR